MNSLPLKMDFVRLVVLPVVMALHAVQAQSFSGCKLNDQCCLGLSGSRTNCNSGFFCDANTGGKCQYNCGKYGQFCCPNSSSNNGCANDLFCEFGYGNQQGVNRCIEHCGQENQRCCRNFWCAQGLYCDGTALTCKTGAGVGPKDGCGNTDSNCCDGGYCVAGTYCDTTSNPAEKKCRQHCGAVGQKCCPVKSTGYDGCNGNQNIYCDTNTGYCTPNCGFEGQKCCPQGFCHTGTNCNGNAYCEANRSGCGSVHQKCCTNGLCALGYRCDGANKCTEKCGQKGQKCCALKNNLATPRWCEPPLMCKADGTCTDVV